MRTPPRVAGVCDRVQVDSYTVATVLAALGEYAAAHPELVAQVYQAEAAVLAEWAVSS